MTEGSPGCLFVVFTLCLNDETVFEEAQAYCLLPSRTDSPLAAEGRTARADAARDDGVLAAVRRPPADGRPTLMLRTCGSTRRINELPSAATVRQIWTLCGTFRIRILRGLTFDMSGSQRRYRT
jgi:hypothetical protein